MRRLFFTVVGLTILLTVASGLTGCAKGPTAREIVTKATDAMANVTSFETVMATSMDIIAIGNKATELNMTLHGDGLANVSNKKSKMSMEVTSNQASLGMQTVSLEIYTTSEWQYVQIPMPPAGNRWVKTKLPDGTQWEGQLSSQLSLLAAATEMKLQPEETVNNITCYVIEAKPDITTLLQQLLSQSMTQYSIGLQEQDFSSFDYSKVLKEISIRAWISKSDSRILKSQANLVLELKPEDIGNEPGDFDKMSFEMNMVISFSNFNAVVDFELPEEALNAPESSLP